MGSQQAKRNKEICGAVTSGDTGTSRKGTRVTMNRFLRGGSHACGMSRDDRGSGLVTNGTLSSRRNFVMSHGLDRFMFSPADVAAGGLHSSNKEAAVVRGERHWQR